MPANLTPEYLAAEQEFKEAQTPEQKLAALEKMLSTIPKHKGTEKLQADIKRRISRMRKESARRSGPRHTPFWVVKREGAGQVALIGPPNAGKSQLLARLTHAHPEVADYPFTTRAPVPGMMHYENVPVQLVDLPPLSPEFTERWLPQVIRMANAGLLVVGMNDPAVLEEIEFALEYLGAHRLPVPEILVANKMDAPGSADNLEALQELYGGRFRYLPVSAKTGAGLDELAKTVFELLDVVRFYSKPPGKQPDFTKPFVLKRGATVIDAAREVHKDFAEKMKFTRLYRRDGDHPGMMVDRGHVVEDEDILEFHI